MSNSMRTPLAQVRGLGAARDGVGHFIKQRVTAIGLIVLVPWFLFSLICATRGADAAERYGNAIEWVGQPVNAVLILLAVGAALYHMRLGMQVVIEDYFPGHGARVALLILNTFVSVVMFAAAAFAVIKIAG